MAGSSRSSNLPHLDAFGGFVDRSRMKVVIGAGRWGMTRGLDVELGDSSGDYVGIVPCRQRGRHRCFHAQGGYNTITVFGAGSGLGRVSGMELATEGGVDAVVPRGEDTAVFRERSGLRQVSGIELVGSMSVAVA